MPVRPRPARQWTASAPREFSAMRRKRSAIASEGVEQSTKKRSWCAKPALSNVCLWYSFLLRRTTPVTPFAWNTSR